MRSKQRVFPEIVQLTALDMWLSFPPEPPTPALLPEPKTQARSEQEHQAKAHVVRLGETISLLSFSQTKLSEVHKYTVNLQKVMMTSERFKVHSHIHHKTRPRPNMKAWNES